MNALAAVASVVALASAHSGVGLYVMDGTTYQRYRYLF